MVHTGFNLQCRSDSLFNAAERRMKNVGVNISLIFNFE